LLINLIVKVQESNITRLKNFKKKEMKGKEGRKREEKTAAYRQQDWRRYNDVKTQGYSPCGLLIRAFLMFEHLSMFF